MRIRVGYELVYECPQPTPMILTLNVHFTRVSDLVTPDHITTRPTSPISGYRDGFGNWCSRIVAPPGDIRISMDALVNDSGLPDAVDRSAWQHAVENLPAETAGVSAWESLLRNRSAFRDGVATLRTDPSRMATRASDLRFRT